VNIIYYIRIDQKQGDCMTEEKFKKYRDFFSTTLIIKDSESSVLKLTKSIPGLYQQAIDIFTDQLRETKDLAVLKEEIYSKHWKKFYDGNKTYSKPEIDVLIKQQQSYLNVCIEYNKQEMYLKYFEATMDNIKKVSFQIKNYIDVKKFFAGDY
jgi:hypothetical protein